MGHRVFNVVVVVFWLATMSWLVVVKVLPPLQVGEPPNYRSVYAMEPDAKQESVAWQMFWNERPMGWAATKIERKHGGVTEVGSFVHFSRLPVDELAPAWLRPVLRSAAQPLGALAMEARSRLEIDPLGRLSFISSRMQVVGFPAEIVILGKVQGTTIKGTVRAGTLFQSFERYLPPDALMGDELSPQARIPGLRVGQEWTVPVYSPLRFSDNRNPVEILHAKVEGYESIPSGDRSVLALAVVYRSDSGSILGGSQSPRGKLWVAEDGTVLKQTAYLFGSQLTFERASGDTVKKILKESAERASKFDERNRTRRRSREIYGAPKSSAAPVSNAEPATHTSHRGTDVSGEPSGPPQNQHAPPAGDESER